MDARQLENMVQSLQLDEESPKESEGTRPPFDGGFRAPTTPVTGASASSPLRRPNTQGKQRQRQRFDSMHESDVQRMQRLSALGRSLRVEKGGGRAGAHARDSRPPSVNNQPGASPDNLAANSDASLQQKLLNKLDAKMRKQK